MKKKILNLSSITILICFLTFLFVPFAFAENQTLEFEQSEMTVEVQPENGELSTATLIVDNASEGSIWYKIVSSDDEALAISESSFGTPLKLITLGAERTQFSFEFLPKKIGTYTISALNNQTNDVEAVCTITVENSSVSGLVLPATLELNPNADSKVITARIPGNKSSEYEIIWTVDNPNDCVYEYAIATGDHSCVVAPTENCGTATVTATLKGDSSKSASCVVTVKETEENKKEDEEQDPGEKEDDKKEEDMKETDKTNSWLSRCTKFWKKVFYR